MNFSVKNVYLSSSSSGLFCSSLVSWGSDVPLTVPSMFNVPKVQSLLTFYSQFFIAFSMVHVLCQMVLHLSALSLSLWSLLATPHRTGSAFCCRLFPTNHNCLSKMEGKQWCTSPKCLIFKYSLSMWTCALHTHNNARSPSWKKGFWEEVVNELHCCSPPCIL